MFAAAWRAAGHAEPPTFHGVPYDTMVDDSSTIVTKHTCSSRTLTATCGSIAATLLSGVLYQQGGVTASLWGAVALAGAAGVGALFLPPVEGAVSWDAAKSDD